MAIVEEWFPPTREHWEQILFYWQLFPLFTTVQWFSSYYPMGKTSETSRFNVPGKLGWVTMEAPGFITLLYTMWSVSSQEGIVKLPWPNWLMAGLFTFHYLYRALIGPLLNPTMSPIHIIVWLAALGFQLTNGICIGGWLGGYGPRTFQAWQGETPRALLPRIEVGMMIWALGLMSNMFHDDELREIRRAAARQQRKKAEIDGKPGSKSVAKVYAVPQNGLFRAILYPHFFSEWIEWVGFWMVGGFRCVPARAFLINEIAAMLPRALQGKQWYLEKFGPEKVGDKKAVIPWIL